MRRHGGREAHVGIVGFVKREEVFGRGGGVDKSDSTSDVGCKSHHGDLTPAGAQTKGEPVGRAGDLRELDIGIRAAVEDDVDE